MKEILILFVLVILQNASFTLVSRARNSNSLLYHGVAAVFSNGIWLLVIRHIILNPNNVSLMITYVIAAVIGSIGMHYVAMRFFEKKKVPVVQKPSVGRIVHYTAIASRGEKKVFPAIITATYGDDIVDLQVFGFETIVRLASQGDVVGKWNWPSIK